MRFTSGTIHVHYDELTDTSQFRWLKHTFTFGGRLSGVNFSELEDGFLISVLGPVARPEDIAPVVALITLD